MPLFNINDVPPSELAGLLDNIEGITPEVAKDIGNLAAARGGFASAEDLSTTLEGLGVERPFLARIGEAIEVAPPRLQPSLERDVFLQDRTKPSLPALYDKNTFFISLASESYQRVAFPSILAHIKGPDGRWYPVPDEKNPRNVRKVDPTKQEDVGGARVTVNKASGKDLDAFPGKPKKNPFVVTNGKQTNFVTAVKFSFKPKTPCARNPPYQVIQTYSYVVKDAKTKKTLGSDVAIETNPDTPPFPPVVTPGGTVEYFDAPGPGLEELKQRSPDVDNFIAFFQFEQYVVDQCTDEIVARVSWAVFMRIAFDANGNFDIDNSSSEVISG